MKGGRALHALLMCIAAALVAPALVGAVDLNVWLWTGHTTNMIDWTVTGAALSFFQACAAVGGGIAYSIDVP